MNFQQEKLVRLVSSTLFSFVFVMSMVISLECKKDFHVMGVWMH